MQLTVFTDGIACKGRLKMSSIRFLVLCGVVCLAVSVSSSVNAQPPTAKRYVPSRPTFSPYLDYFRRDVGMLNPFHAFQTRTIRQNQMIQQQRDQMARDQHQLRRQRQELTRVQGEVRRFRETGAGPTGRAATFMSYSHYFGAQKPGTSK